MAKSPPRRAFLVAVLQRRAPARVYAVMQPTPEAAVKAILELATPDAQVELTGSLSRDLARRIHLQPGEIRLLA